MASEQEGEGGKTALDGGRLRTYHAGSETVLGILKLRGESPACLAC